MGQLISLILPLIIFVAIMYFMIIRPQKKQMETAQNMYDSLTPGDSIVTIGGLHGVIDEVNNTESTIVLDCEGVYLTFDLRAVSRVEDSQTVETTTSTATEAREAEEEDVTTSEDE